MDGPGGGSIVFGGTCPICCGDLSRRQAAASVALSCRHCGAEVRAQIPAAEPQRLPLSAPDAAPELARLRKTA